MEFNQDFLSRQADPNELGAILQRQGSRLQQIGQGFVRVQSLDEIASAIGELDFRAVDSNGNLRMIMSAINLLDEFGIDAHFAGFDVNGVAQIYLSADDGSLVAGGGEVALDQNGITIQTSVSAPALANSVKWVDASENVIDQIYSYYAGIVAYGGNEVIAPASGAIEDASNAITAQARDATVAQIILKAFNSASPNSILLNAEIINSNGDIDLASGKTYKIDGVDILASGSAVLGADYSITSAAGTYEDTGLSITLPAKGTYLVRADVRGKIKGNAGTYWWLTGKFYNSTDAADVVNSERIIVLTNQTAVELHNTAPITAIVTVAASKTIKLYAFRHGAGTPSWTTSQIGSDANGRTVMSYECLKV